MINVCVEEATKINMSFNAKKCAVLRFGNRYSSPCAAVKLEGSAIDFVSNAKYLCVMLHSSKQFAVDLHYMKVKFYKSFNCLFHKAGRLKDKLVTLHLVSSFCRPYLLYATECLGLTATQMRSLRNTWQCAVSHIFNLRGTNVNFICATTDNASLDTVIATRSIKFLRSLQDVHGQHPVLHNLYARIGKRELFWLRTLTDD